MDELIEILRAAIANYNYPTVAYDFENGEEIQFENMLQVEEYIGAQLHSDHIENVKNGLSNVLYWGYAKVGFRDVRVNNFRIGVTNVMLDTFIEVRNQFRLSSIKEIAMPEYSGMPFVSKVLMFLNPNDYVVLDNQLYMNYHIQGQIDPISMCYRAQNAQFNITAQNNVAFYYWCQFCRSLGREYDLGRPVNVERGFFQLIDDGNQAVGLQILDHYFNNN